MHQRRVFCAASLLRGESSARGLRALLFILTYLSGCARQRPGETFSAGYILTDKQSKVSHDFVVRNLTSKPVKIETVEKSCGCTSFNLGKYALAPGEAATFTMNVDVTKGYMQKYATCILKTDDPQFKNWAYSVQFTSVPFVVADPTDLNLGTFTADGKNLNDVHRATLELFADTKVELTRDNISVPDEIELTINSSSPEVHQLQRDVWSTKYQITVGLSPKGRDSVLRNTQFALKTTVIRIAAGKQNSWRGQYSVYWQTSAPLESHPSHVSFGNLLDGDGHSRRITISSTTNEKFRIVSIKEQSPDVRIESTVNTSDEAALHRVNFEVPGFKRSEGRPSDAPRRFLSGRIQIQTTNKLQPVVEIPWSAMLDPSVGIHAREDNPRSSSEPRS